MQLIEAGQVIDGPGQDQIDLSFIPELLRIRGDMPVVVVRVLEKVRTVLLLYILRHFHIVVCRRQEITENTIQLRLRMVDLKLQQDRQHIDRLICREGTWDAVIWKLVLDIVIAQLAREENDIALSLHILVDGIDVTHLSIDILKKLTAEIMLCDDLLYRLQRMIRAYNCNINHRSAPYSSTARTSDASFMTQMPLTAQWMLQRMHTLGFVLRDTVN